MGCLWWNIAVSQGLDNSWASPEREPGLRRCSAACAPPAAGAGQQAGAPLLPPAALRPPLLLPLHLACLAPHAASQLCLPAPRFRSSLPAIMSQLVPLPMSIAHHLQT